MSYAELYLKELAISTGVLPKIPYFELIYESHFSDEFVSWYLDQAVTNG